MTIKIIQILSLQPLFPNPQLSEPPAQKSNNLSTFLVFMDPYREYDPISVDRLKDGCFLLVVSPLNLVNSSTHQHRLRETIPLCSYADISETSVEAKTIARAAANRSVELLDLPDEF